MRLLSKALVVCSVVSATPAYAAEKNVTVRVSHENIDLSDKDGLAAFKTRAVKAAVHVCKVEAPVGTRGTSLDASCVEQAVNLALAAAKDKAAVRVAVRD